MTNENENKNKDFKVCFNLHVKLDLAATATSGPIAQNIVERFAIEAVRKSFSNFDRQYPVVQIDVEQLGYLEYD